MFYFIICMCKLMCSNGSSPVNIWTICRSLVFSQLIYTCYSMKATELEVRWYSCKEKNLDKYIKNLIFKSEGWVILICGVYTSFVWTAPCDINDAQRMRQSMASILTRTTSACLTMYVSMKSENWKCHSSEGTVL